MNTLPKELLCCPLCQGDWIRDYGYENNSWGRYTCPNSELCNIVYYTCHSSENFYVQKFVDDKTIWWGTGERCEVVINKTWKKLTFLPPFEIDSERLKLIILMS